MSGGASILAAADPLSGSGPHSLRRSGRARTNRVRDDFIDSTFLQYVSPVDEPHAFLEEDDSPLPSSTSKRSPAPKSAPSPNKGPSSGIPYGLPEPRPVGPQHQVSSIPTCRTRPAQPSKWEAAFLAAQPLFTPPLEQQQQQLGSSHGASAAAAASFKAAYQAAPGAAARRGLLCAAVQEADAALGPQLVQGLSLGSLGSKLRCSWQPHEELLFCLGMCDKYRFFKYIRQCYLWQRSAHELNGYYHNVWKTRSTPEADTFMRLREEGAGGAALGVFLDGIRGRLTSMWDRRLMGDMPKLLKDAAAAAEADTQLQAAAAAVALEGPPSRADTPDTTPSDSLETAAAAAAAVSSDDSEGAARPVVTKPRQRKRPAAGSSRQRGQQQQAVKQEAAAAAAGLVVAQQQQQQQARAAAVLAAAGAQQQQERMVVKEEEAAAAAAAQQGRNKRQRQQRSSAAAGAATGAAAAAGSGPAAPSVVEPLPAVLQYPEMPTYPDVDCSSVTAVESWLSHLPSYRGLMVDYMAVVNGLTDSAVAAYSARIAEVQQQRDRLQAEADAYIRALLAQGQTVLQRMQAATAAAKQQQQQQQAAVLLPQQQQQQAVCPDSAGDLQSQVQQLLLSHTKKAAAKQQQQEQPSRTAAPAASAQQPTKQEQQLPTPPQQEQQLRQQSPGDAALPFPMGPASNWLLTGQGCAVGGQLSHKTVATSRLQQHPTTAAAAVPASPAAGCGGSSSEDGDVFIDGMMA